MLVAYGTVGNSCIFSAAASAVLVAYGTIGNSCIFQWQVTMHAINRYHAGKGPAGKFSETPTLFLEFQGTAAGVKEQAEAVRELADAAGGSAFK